MGLAIVWVLVFVGVGLGLSRFSLRQMASGGTLVTIAAWLWVGQKKGFGVAVDVVLWVAVLATIFGSLVAIGWLLGHYKRIQQRTSER